MELIDIRQDDKFSIAHKCECGAIFIANKDDIFLDYLQSESNELIGNFSVNVICPNCQKTIELNVTQFPQSVIRELVDIYFDNILNRKREK